MSSLGVSEGKEIYQNLFDSLKDGIIITDLEGKILDANQAYLDMLRYTKKQLKRLSYQQLTPKKWQKVEEDIVKSQIMKRGYSDEYEKELIRIDGSVFPVTIRVWQAKTKDRRLIGMWSIVKDNTEKKKSDFRLKESGYKLRKQVKELTCLYGISKLVGNPDITIEGIIHETLELILPAWQFSNNSCARIFYGNKEFKTNNFKETKWRLSNSTTIGEKNLRIEVYYLENRPFLEEEKDLINEIGSQLKLILKQKEAEQGINHTHSEFYQIFAASNPMYVTDLDYNIMKVNERFCNLFQLKKTDIIGKKCYDIWKGNLCSTPECSLKQILSGKEQYEYEITKEFNDGKLLFYIVNNYPLYNLNDELVGIIKSFTDISSKNLTEQKLKTSKEKYRNLIETSTMGFLEINLESGQVDYINPKFLEIISYERQELENETLFYKILYPEDFRDFTKNLDNRKIEFRIMSKDKEIKWLSGTRKYQYNSIGQPKKLILWVQEITENKIMEQNLKESEEKFRTITEQSLIGIQILQDNRTIYINQQWVEISGYSVEEILRWNLEDHLKFIHPDDREKVKQQLTKKQKGDQDVLNRYQVKCIKKSGETIWVEIFATSITYNGKFADLAMIIDITEAKLTQQKLKESEEKFKVIAEQSPMELIIIQDNKVKYANPQSANITGIPVSEISKWNIKRIFENIHPDDLNLFRENVRKTLNNSPDALKHLEYRVINDTGEILWVASHGMQIHFEGKPAHVIASIDITNRKTLEHQLKESEEKYRLISENANDLIVILDQNSKYEYINEQVHKELMGYLYEDLLGKSALNFIHPDDFKEVSKKLKKGFETGEGIGEARMRKKNGTYLWFEVKGRTFINKDGLKKGLLISRDITDRKKAEEEVVNLAKFPEENPNPVLRISKEFVLYANQTGLDLFNIKVGHRIPTLLREGINRAFEENATQILEVVLNNYFYSLFITPIKGTSYVNVYGMDITERKKAEKKLKERIKERTCLYDISKLLSKSNMKQEELFQSIIDRIPEAFHNPEITSVRLTINNKEYISKNFIESEFRLMNPLLMDSSEIGQLEVFQSKLVLSKDKSPFLKEERALIEGICELIQTFFIRDVLNENLKNTLNDLKRSNEDLEHFAYIASHDLQEPLRMVKTFNQLLQKRYQNKLEKDANDFINFSIEGVTRMEKLIQDLLKYSRVGSNGNPFKKIEMNRILETVLMNLSRQVQDNKAKILRDPLPVIFGDESQMIQLLQNLISNAMKFHGGETPEVHISSEVKENEYLFSVKDNGIGIDPKNFDRLFVIFQRLHKRSEYEGTGIGLAVCKKIVQLHRGKIWVESETGKGSTFYFSIPKPKDLR